jgi:hypothetical protein
VGAVVTFNYTTWVTRYPEFAGVAQPLAQLYFNEATLYCDNAGSGPVNDAPTLSLLLNMLTAHIAQLNAALNGQAASPLVGRVSEATEGSVSVRTDMPAMPGSAAWFQQTKYGLAFWQATAQFRTFRPVMPRRRFGFGGFGGRVF